jgi:DNA polymerase III epsilon subunit-like protein
MSGKGTTKGRMKHVMIDLETLGTTADAVILSIGAVRFDLDSTQMDDMGFYTSISIDSNTDAKRRIDEDTLLWWLKQPAAAQGVFREAKTTLRSALVDLSDWIGTDDNFVWSNGADFDLPMLAHAYRGAGIEQPWKFWNSRCLRTYRALPGMKNVSVPRSGTHHNALDDAVYQVQLVQAIQSELTGKGKPIKQGVPA